MCNEYLPLSYIAATADSCTHMHRAPWKCRAFFATPRERREIGIIIYTPYIYIYMHTGVRSDAYTWPLLSLVLDFSGVWMEFINVRLRRLSRYGAIRHDTTRVLALHPAVAWLRKSIRIHACHKNYMMIRYPWDINPNNFLIFVYEFFNKFFFLKNYGKRLNFLLKKNWSWLVKSISCKMLFESIYLYIERKMFGICNYNYILL